MFELGPPGPAQMVPVRGVDSWEREAQGARSLLFGEPTAIPHAL